MKKIIFSVIVLSMFVSEVNACFFCRLFKRRHHISMQTCPVPQPILRPVSVKPIPPTKVTPQPVPPTKITPIPEPTPNTPPSSPPPPANK